MKSDFNFNYVVIGATASYFDVIYKDIQNLENVRYFSYLYSSTKNKFIYILQRITFSRKINTFINVPLGKFTFPLTCKFHFNNNRPICFIFFGNSIFLMKTKYMDYLSRKYPNSKKILYMQDLVSRNNDFDLKWVNKEMDFIFSYDKGDCRKYGFIYLPTPLSMSTISNNNMPYSDIFFCGLAKSPSRYNMILDVYNQCSSKGLKCIFFIPDAPYEKRIKNKGLIYDRKLLYEDNLKYMQHSKCILDITQDNATGYTLRLWESILYNKHILTNNLTVEGSDYYNSAAMHFIPNNLNDITTWINQSIKYSSEMKDLLSPINWLSYIDLCCSK